MSEPNSTGDRRREPEITPGRLGVGPLKHVEDARRRIPSRRMPADAPAKPSFWAWLLTVCFLVAIIGAAGWGIKTDTKGAAAGGAGLLAYIGYLAILSKKHKTMLARVAAERAGESICTFARAFDCRQVDTWIIRAVFDELQPFCQAGRVRAPLRAGDDLYDFLRFDSDDIEDVAFVAARRAGRSMDQTEENPLFGIVRTPADMVIFLMFQPRVAA